MEMAGDKIFLEVADDDEAAPAYCHFLDCSQLLQLMKVSQLLLLLLLLQDLVVRMSQLQGGGGVAEEADTALDFLKVGVFDGVGWCDG